MPRCKPSRRRTATSSLPFALALFAGMGLGLAACVPYTYYTVPNDEYDALSAAEQAQFRRSIRPCTDRTDLESDEALGEQCTLSIIEFDDQGDFWKPRQLDDTLELISEKSNRQGGEALVVVFVHGWKNDASPENETEKNLGSFKKVLLQLTREEMRRGEAVDVQHRSVVGVYMAWHGLSSRNKILKQISFFARKNAATRVARVSFSHAIHRIVAHTKGSFSNRLGNPHSVAAVVGHSFGGLIVENTLLRTLTVETNEFEAYGADLTVLVNPANEAILARQSVHALRGAPPRKLELGGETVSRPLIVSVTSVADTATGDVFPLGLWIKGIFKSFREYEDHEPGIRRQKFYYTHTPGHITPEGALYSHDLTCPLELDERCRAAPESGDAYLAAVESRTRSTKGDLETIFPPPAVRLADCHRAAEQAAEVRCIDRLSFVGAATGQHYAVERDASSANQTGYWILQIPATIVPDHSDIFQSELASLLAAFINLERATIVDDLSAAEAYLQEAYPDG